MVVKYRIGVDVRCLNNPITGIGRYTSEVLRRLIKMGHEWFLYSPGSLRANDWSNFQNVQIRNGEKPSGYQSFLWMQTMVPYYSAKDSLDLFWSPAHRLPFFLSSKITKVVTIHDLVWKFFPETMLPLTYWLDRFFMPRAVEQADSIIAVSLCTAKDMVNEFPFTRGKIFPIPLGVSLSAKAKPRCFLQKMGISNPYFLFVGTIEPRKNLIRLLDAYSQLKDTDKNKATLVIAGATGWGGVDIIKAAKKLGINNRVLVLGYVNDEELATLYAHAEFLAMPSLYEGFGLPLIEAMSHGTPVLTSNCASMPEVAGGAGLLVNPKDIGSISNGIALMLEDGAVKRALSDQCKNNLKRFSWDAAAEETLKIFEKSILVKKFGISFNAD